MGDQSVNYQCQETTSPKASTLTVAYDLLEFFIQKLSKIRKSTECVPVETYLPLVPVIFQQYSSANVKTVINNAPSTSCDFYHFPLPIIIVKIFLPHIHLSITDMYNFSLHKGLLPKSPCHAIIIPRQNTANADSFEL